jgi:hypothetical protein
MAGQQITESVPGWCEIEGCSEKFMQFMIAGETHTLANSNFQDC